MFRKISRPQLALSSPSRESGLARLWRSCRRHNPEIASHPSDVWPSNLHHRRRSPRPRLSLGSLCPQYIRLCVLPASAVLTRATPPTLAWVATPLALARSLLPPGHIRTQHNTRARSRRGIMMEADSALSMGRDRHPPPAVRSPALGPARCGSRLSTSEFESEGAHSSCPPPNLHPSADRRKRAAPQASSDPPSLSKPPYLQTILQTPLVNMHSLSTLTPTRIR
jgi:hypothetical protein